MLMPNPTHPKTVGLLTRYFSRLRFPWLFGVVVTLFGIDLLLPDCLPFMDEILLAATTILLGAWKQRKSHVIEVPREPGESAKLP